MQPSLRRIARLDPGRRRDLEGSRTDLLVPSPYTDSTPEPPGHQPPLVPVQSRVTGFYELVFYV